MSTQEEIDACVIFQRQVLADIKESGPTHQIVIGGRATTLGQFFDAHAGWAMALDDQHRRRAT